MPAAVADILSRRKRLEGDRQGFLDLWQELADVMLPTRADFTALRPVGDRRTQNIYDGTPMQARQGLATAIDTLLKSKTQRWFSVETTDDDLNQEDEAKRWLQDAGERMWNAIYRPVARFMQRSGEVDNDLVTFGTGSLWIGENNDRTHLSFRSCHLRDALIAENADGVVDTHMTTLRLNKRQAIQRYGEENLSAAITKHQKDEDLHEFVHVVQPRADFDPKRGDAKNLPFASMVIEVKGEKIVGESGFNEFPYAVPRWDTGTGEIYGRSPAMVALPDALTLQAQGRTLLKAGEKAVDPPIWATDDAVLGVVRTFPGGITIVSSEAANASGGRPMGVFEMGKNLPIGLNMQQATRQMVEAAFFKNVFNLPIEGPQMTATEILQRREEFLRIVGPLLARLEPDYIGHIAERVFGIMSRTPPRGPGWVGQFPPPPESLKGAEIRFSFVSPVMRARKQIEAAGAMRGMELLSPFIQAQPELMDHFDGDEIARDIPETFGTPMKWLRPLDKVETIRQGRAEQQKQQQMLAMAEQAARAAKDGGGAVKQIADAMGGGQRPQEAA